MPTNQDFSYLNQPIQTDPNTQMLEIMDTSIKSKYPPNQVAAKPLYTEDDINNLGADTRKKVVDYSVPFTEGYQRLNSGAYVARYEDFLSGIDNNQRLAEQQTTSDKWLNGFKKFGAKTGTAIIGGTLGTVNGVIQSVYEGSFDALYDNEFSRTLDDWNTKMDYKLPNYYTKQEQEKGLGGQITTANFWADKVLGGLSFTVGAIVSEGIWATATGGASLAARAARWGAEGTRDFSRVAKGVSSYKDLVKGAVNTAFKGGVANKERAIGMARLAELGNATRYMVTSSGYEAGVEALQYKKEAEERFFNSFKELNGRPPTAEEIATFRNDLNDSSNAVFAGNMAILAPSNLAMYGSLFNIRSPFKGAGTLINKNIFGIGAEAVEEAGTQTAKLLKPTTFQKIAATSYTYGKAPLIEGLFEEGMQSNVSKTASKWIDNSYNSQNINQSSDLIGMFYESMGETYGTKEGWNELGVGMIIGAIGGTVASRGEMSQAREKAKFAASGEATFQSKALLNKFLMSSQMQVAAQSQNEAIAKKDIFGALMAQDDMLHAQMNFKHQMEEDPRTLVKEYEIALENTSVQEFAEMGIEEQDIEQHKKDVLQGYTEQVQNFRKNRQFAEAVIGKGNIAGLSEITAQGNEALNMNNKEALIQALTYSLSKGERVNTVMNDILSRFEATLGTENTKSLRIERSLKAAGSKLNSQYNKVDSELKTAKKEQTALEKELRRLQDAPKPAEGDRTTGNRFGDVNEKIIALAEKVATLSEKRETIFKQAADENKKRAEIAGITIDNIAVEDTIMSSDLDNLNDNLNKIDSIIEQYRELNPQTFLELSKLTQEYQKAQKTFLDYQSTSLALTSGNIKLSENTGWLGKIMNSKKTMDEFSRDWLIDVLDNYQKSKIESLAPQAQEILEVEDMPVPVVTEDEVIVQAPVVRNTKTPSEQLKDRLEKALKNRFYPLTYIGNNFDELSLRKPTQKEVEEYRELLQKGEDNERFQELKTKLEDWKLLDSAVTEENQSFADIIEIVEQLETQIEQEQTIKELPFKDLVEVATTTDAIFDRNANSLLQNTDGTVTAKLVGDEVRFSHLSIYSLIQKFDITPKVRIWEQKGKNKVLSATPKYIDSALLEENAKIPQTEFYFGDVLVRVGDKGQLFLKLEDLDRTGLVVLDSNVVDWSYSDVYEELSNGELRKKASDFTVKLTNGTIIPLDSEAAYEMKEGEILRFEVRRDDVWNDKLSKIARKKNLTEEDKDYIKKNLQIYVISEKDSKKVATVKAQNFTNSSTENNDNFLALRQKAFDMWMKGVNEKNAPLSIVVPATVQVKGIMLGSPNMTVERTEDGYKPKNIEITEAALENIYDQGYILNGKLVTSKDNTKVRKDFTRKLSKATPNEKIPVIVFSHKGQLVAFPVTLQPTEIENPQKAQDLQNILADYAASKATEVETVKKINNLLIQNNISPSVYNLTELNEGIVNQIIEDFAVEINYANVENWTQKGFNKQQLLTDALINIDLTDNPITSPKIQMDLSTLEITTERDALNNNRSGIENQLSDKAKEIWGIVRNDERFRDITDTIFTDAFDDNEVLIAPKNHLETLHNISILKQAFSANLSKKIKEIVGIKEAEVKTLFKQLEFLNKQIVIPNQKEVENLRNKVC